MMKQLIASMVVVAATASAAPPVNIDPSEVNNVVVKNEFLGSGVPGQTFWEPVVQIEDNVYHAPQYLPYHPTAATIWPRVVEVPCRMHRGAMLCEGYNWTPAMGRAEYLYIKPTPVKEPIVITKEVMVPGPTILKEVPVKKKRE